MTGKTTGVTGETTGVTAGTTGKTTGATGVMTGKTVVAGPDCSGNPQLDGSSRSRQQSSARPRPPLIGARRVSSGNLFGRASATLTS